MPINLWKFVSHDKLRPNIQEPFSTGEWSYATDGSILVRVPRRDDVPKKADVLDIDRIWPKGCVKFRAPKILLIPGERPDCFVCGGRGKQHICPSCACQCEICDGSGKAWGNREEPVRCGAIHISEFYARKLLALPGVEVEEPENYVAILQFRFEGGDGLLATIARAGEYSRDCVEI